MALFDPAIEIVLREEGGYVNDPKDSGGATNMGITQRDHPNVDIVNLTVDEAKQIYMDDYWSPNHYDLIDDQDLANKMFSMCVNMGAKQANKAMQRAVTGLVVDGALGPKSFAAINAADPVELLAEYKDQLWAYYEAILAARPKNEKFRRGWRNRCYS